MNKSNSNYNLKKMKRTTKFIMAALLLGLCSLGYSQDVKVNINNQDATTTDGCPYRINGICATEDIGGVNVDINCEWHWDGSRHEYDCYMVLTNYNSFPVNVLWQIEYTGDDRYCDSYNNNIKTGNVVIGATGEKKISLDNDCGKWWTLKGLIVRKLAQ